MRILSNSLLIKSHPLFLMLQQMLQKNTKGGIAGPSLPFVTTGFAKKKTQGGASWPPFFLMLQQMLRKKTQGGHCAPTLLHGATNVVKKDTRGCIAPPSPPLFLMLQQMLQEKLKGGHRDLPSFSCYNKQCEKKHNVPPYSSYCIKCYQKKTQGGA